MAIALELMSGTVPRANGHLDGVLFTVRHVYQGQRGRPVNYHDNAPAGLNALSIARRVLFNVDFHTWRHEHEASLRALGVLTFADVQGTEWFANNLVPLVYYGVIGGYNVDGERHFIGAQNVTRNEAVVMLERLGILGQVEEVSSTVRAMENFNLPHWARDAWRKSNSLILNRWMTPTQAQQVISGDLTRLEAAVILGTLLNVSPDSNLSRGERIDVVNSQSFRNQLAGRFSDMGDVGVYNVNRNEGDWTNALYTIEQRTGVRQMCPQDAWFVLEMANLGIITGFHDGTFKPYDPITRAQFITMVMRAFEVTAVHDTAQLTR
jgi:hypothetical protein